MRFSMALIKLIKKVKLNIFYARFIINQNIFCFLLLAKEGKLLKTFIQSSQPQVPFRESNITILSAGSSHSTNKNVFITPNLLAFESIPLKKIWFCYRLT